MKIKALACVAAVTLCSVDAMAFTECTRPVSGIFEQFDIHMLFVSFSDQGSSINKKEGNVSSGDMARFTAMVLMAQATGRPLTIRYPEDGMACPPPAGVSRDDFIGVWLKQ
jgi:hypothetical protein